MKIFPALLAALMVSTSFLSYADDIRPEDVKLVASPSADNVEENAENFKVPRMIYQTYDQSDRVLDHVESPVTVNGIEYVAISAGESKYIRKDSVKPDTIAYTSEVWTGDGEEQKPTETMEQDGKSYRLKSITKNTAESEERTELKDAKVAYTGIEDGVKIPSERAITFTDKDTKQEVNASIPLKSQEVTGEYWDDSFEFPITISGYNADTYMLGNKEISASADLMNYADDFLSMLALNPEKYSITSIEWDGGQYTEDGLVKRKAIGKGKKLVQNIDAVYEGEVTLPEISGYVWDCEYEEDIPDAEKVVYTMAADVEYAQANAVAHETSLLQKALDAVLGFITAAYTALATSFKEHPVMTSVPFVIAAGLIAFLITRKVRNRCIYNQSLKCPHAKHTSETCKGCPNFYKRGEAPKATLNFDRFRKNEKK